MFKLATVTSLISLAVAIVATSAAEAALPGRDGLIAFTQCEYRGCESPTDTLVTDADGSDIRSLGLSGPVSSWEIDWHPNGSKVLNSGSEVGGISVHTLGQASGHLLVSGDICPRSGGGRWSPDGRRIAFDRYSQACPDDVTPVPDGIWLMNADGTGQKVLFGAENRYPYHSATWSPDGTRLAFIGREGEFDNWNIYVGKADGTGLTNVTKDDSSDYATPSWSPDGKSIAYSSGGDIWTMQPSGYNRKRLTRSAAFDYSPDYSPTGGRIVYASDNDIWVMNASDGSQARNLTRTPAIDEVRPDWQSLTATTALLSRTAPTLDAAAYVPEATIKARAELRNDTSSAILIQRGVITARPPNSSRSGGPLYYDFSGGTPTETVPAHSARVISGSFTLPANAPVGRYDVYLTYRDANGVWHDGLGTYVDVTSAAQPPRVVQPTVPPAPPSGGVGAPPVAPVVGVTPPTPGADATPSTPGSARVTSAQARAQTIRFLTRRYRSFRKRNSTITCRPNAATTAQICKVRWRHRNKAYSGTVTVRRVGDGYGVSSEIRIRRPRR